MRALVITAPQRAEVQDVAPPEPAAGQVVVDVRRAGVCGTDVEFFAGEMAYLHSGHAEYPIRIGHEWMGIVSATGEGVDKAWIGARVTGDTMLGCGTCRRCRRELGRLAAAVAGLTVAQAGANPPTRIQLDTEMNRRLDAAH